MSDTKENIISLAEDKAYQDLPNDRPLVKEFVKKQSPEQRDNHIQESLQKENKNLKRSDYLRYAVHEELPAIIADLDAIRLGDEANNIPAKEITIEEYLHHRYGIEKSLDAVYELFSADPSMHTLEQFMTSEDLPNSNLFVPEIILSLVKTGRENDTRYNYKELISGTTRGNRTAEFRVPILDPMALQWTVYSDGDEVRTDAFPTFREKNFHLKKISTGFRLTDDVRQMSKINLITHFFEELGFQQNETFKAIIVPTLINGDGLDIINRKLGTRELDPSVPVVGVKTPNATTGITYQDLALAWVTMGEIGRMPTGNLVGKQEIVRWDDEFASFNNQDSGKPKGMLDIQANLPVKTKALTDPRINAVNQTLLFDKTKACRMYMGSGGMRVEMERSAGTEMNKIYVRDDIRVVNIWSDARLLLDGSLDIATNPYPASFTARTYDIEGYF